MSTRDSDGLLADRLRSMEERLRKAEQSAGASREISTEALLFRSRTGDRIRVVAHESGLLAYNLTASGGPEFWPVDAPPPVLIAGDSIAAGVPYNGGVPWSSSLLLPGVVNVAMGGQAWRPGVSLPPFVQTILEAPGDRSTVIISGGTNDIGALTGSGVPTDEIVEIMSARITDDLATLHSHGFRVYLTTIWPVGDPATFVGFLVNQAILPAAREAIIAVNTWLREQHFIRLIDLDPTVCDGDLWMRPDWDTVDHVHPSVASNGPVAAAVDQAFGLRA